MDIILDKWQLATQSKINSVAKKNFLIKLKNYVSLLTCVFLQYNCIKSSLLYSDFPGWPSLKLEAFLE